MIEDAQKLLGPTQTLTALAVARVLHSLDSPAFPRKTWCRCPGWGAAGHVPFEQLRGIALQELLDGHGKARQGGMDLR